MHVLGIDIGSTASKVAILDEGKNLVATAVCSLGTGTSGARRALDDAFSQAGFGWEGVARTVATGYGRQRFEQADKQMSELSCHARGMHHLLGDARTVIDIGGQDVKVLRVGDDGMLGNFVMNEKCAAGTGRFLDVMAQVLETEVAQLEVLDAAAARPVEISSTCTVFAESEVISHLSAGESIPDIVAGIHVSVAKRTAGLARRLGVVERVAMSGGVAQNGGVVRALSRELDVPIAVPDRVQLTGALGAALYALDGAMRDRSRC